MIYITECGDGYCKLEKSQLYQRRVADGTRPQACREHGGLVVQRRKVCAVCGNEFYLELKSDGSGVHCRACDPKIPNHEKNSNATPVFKIGPQPKRKRNPIPEKLRGWAINIRGDYCKKLSLCRKSFKYLPCKACDNYVGIFKWHDPKKSIGA